jgi:uncharacterized membrane protein YgcG
MKNYKCNARFISIGGQPYHPGQIIQSSDYERLNYFDQRNFTHQSDIVDDVIDVAGSIIVSDIIEDLLSSNNNDNTSPSSNNSASNDFDGFGGGDFGGGGASGDW